MISKRGQHSKRPRATIFNWSCRLPVVTKLSFPRGKAKVRHMKTLLFPRFKQSAITKRMTLLNRNRTVPLSSSLVDEIVIRLREVMARHMRDFQELSSIPHGSLRIPVRHRSPGSQCTEWTVAFAACSVECVLPCSRKSYQSRGRASHEFFIWYQVE